MAGTKADKSTICRLARVNWRTVGRIVARVCADELDPERLDGLFEIGVDEVAWRGGHRYLTLVCDHRRGKLVWGAEGSGAAAADRFFAELGPDRSSQIEAISMDMGPGYAKSARRPGHAPQAVICIDSFHVTRARPATRSTRSAASTGTSCARSATTTPRDASRTPAGRCPERPENLTSRQAQTLAAIKAAGGEVARAHTLTQALRAIFAPGLSVEDVAELLTRFCSRASRSRLAPFIRVAKTIRRHRQGILAAARLGLTNARAEALN